MGSSLGGAMRENDDESLDGRSFARQVYRARLYRFEFASHEPQPGWSATPHPCRYRSRCKPRREFIRSEGCVSNVDSFSYVWRPNSGERAGAPFSDPERESIIAQLLHQLQKRSINSPASIPACNRARRGIVAEVLNPDKRCRLRRSTQHLLGVYSLEFEILEFFLDVDSSAARPGR